MAMAKNHRFALVCGYFSVSASKLAVASGIDTLKLKFKACQHVSTSPIEKLSIMCCKSIETVPLGIEHLTTLKVLEFCDMPEELIKTLNPNAEGGVYRKVSSIPEVYYTYCRDREWEVYSLYSSGERVLSGQRTVESHLKRIAKN